MPSPFPGMDPYLEDPGLWPDVHHELISVARHILTEQIGAKYSVRIEERVYISDESDPGRHLMVPDLRIIDRSSGRRSADGYAMAAAAVVEPVEVTTLIEEEIHEPRIEIIDRKRRVVVTVIEVLSPANKMPGSRGRSSYEEKRLEVMRSPSHLVEIDLLRGGAGFPPQEELPPYDYCVHVSRVQRRPRGFLWPIQLENRLPIIKLPLLQDDPDADLDLQAMLNTAYELARYDQEIDYRSGPIPPLTPRQADWAAKLLGRANP